MKVEAALSLRQAYDEKFRRVFKRGVLTYDDRYQA